MSTYMSNKEQIKKIPDLSSGNEEAQGKKIETEAEKNKEENEKEFGRIRDQIEKREDEEYLLKLIKGSKDKKESPEERDEKIEDIKAQLGAG